MAALIVAAGWHGSSQAQVAVIADHLLVKKSQRLMFLMAGDIIVRTYPIALGGAPVGPKRTEGDQRTPEGRYVIDGRNPNSPYHLSLHLSYPNARDVALASAAGVSAGGDIAIHGLPEDFGGPDPFMFTADWTNGCIGVGNRAIEELWALVPDGFPVEIRP
jgi:murein L,D-transpeptidase YafK